MLGLAAIIYEGVASKVEGCGGKKLSRVRDVEITLN